MRRPRRDDLWDRTPGGLIVPRRVGLPTRRFIGWMGCVKDCCGGCNVCAEAGESGLEFDATWPSDAISYDCSGTSCSDYIDGNTFRLAYYGTAAPSMSPALNWGDGSACQHWWQFTEEVTLCGATVQTIVLAIWKAPNANMYLQLKAWIGGSTATYYVSMGAVSLNCTDSDTYVMTDTSSPLYKCNWKSGHSITLQGVTP